ncbi:MAG TPA: hypothetical protein VN892_00590 [Solirubrobacteraceae bacterium]|nr:hypothetical protein [Solirubrobacteraceae bacterium]
MMRVVRRIAAVWLALAAVGITAACGSSKTVSSASTGQSVTKAQAVAYADAVNLRESDVRELVGGRPEPERRFERALRVIERGGECEEGVDSVGAIAGIRSPAFPRGTALQKRGFAMGREGPIKAAQSSVFVMSSRTVASRNFAFARTGRFRACLEHVYASRHLLGGGSGEANGMHYPFTDVVVSTLRPPLTAVPSYELRVTAEVSKLVTGESGQSPYEEDLLVLQLGPTEVLLSTTGVPHPFPQATEQRLFTLLYNRAKAHKL